MYSIILPRLCYALHNLMAKRVWYVQDNVSAATKLDLQCQSWVVISLNLAVHVIMCKVFSNCNVPCAYEVMKTITTLLLPVVPKYGYACALQCLNNVSLRHSRT
jgi:hypothetical protein